MKEIPSAEELLRKTYRIMSDESIENIAKIMKQFTKLHVKAALEASYITSHLKWKVGETGVLTREDLELIYPETNIK